MKGDLIMPVIYYTYYTPSSSISDTVKQEHFLGRALLIKGLSELFHLTLTHSDLDIALTYDNNGKPHLTQYPNINFNITHCENLVACAFHNNSIGIDAELPAYFPKVLIDRALSEKEKCFLLSKSTTTERQEWFYRLWTLKEAYVKKSGIGVDTNLKDFSFSFDVDKKTIAATCSDSSITCYQTKLSHGHILSACYENTSEPTKLVFCSLPHEPQK